MRNDERQWTPGPWFACAGDECEELRHNGKRCYYPHVHIGPRDEGMTYVGGDGRRSPMLSAHITINDISNALGRDGVPDVDRSMDAHDANAHLIAAAPEMYEALRRIEATLIAGKAGRSVGRYSFPANGDTAAVLHAALAKADGK